MKSSANPNVFPKTESDVTNTNAFTQTDLNATKRNAFQKTVQSTTVSSTTVSETLSAPTSVSSNATPTHEQTHEKIHKQTRQQSHIPTEQLLSTRQQSHTSIEQPSATICGMSRSRYIAQAGVIAALYAAATLIVLVLFQSLAWGPVQFRISEAICVVAALTPAAIPGLTAGCVLANLMNIAFSGVGALGLFDVIFGSCATLLGALFCWRMRTHAGICVLGFIVANAVIVPLYLPVLVQGLGFYTIPFTTISLDGLYGVMYIFGLVATGIGEAVVMYALGEPLLAGLKRAGLAEELSDQ